jgi:adenylylsulfate kinase-like enzyme
MTSRNNPSVFWFFGLSGSGKSTLSNLLHDQLKIKGISTVCIDGDQLRNGINQDLGFSSEDRMENIRRSAEIAKLLLENHEIVIASFITPEEQHREKVREILGTSVRFIFVDADSGTMTNFTGISAPFEYPSQVDLVLKTNEKTQTECLFELLKTYFSD